MATFKTANDVKTIKPPTSGRVEWFYEGNEKGLSLRVTAKGKYSWYFTYRDRNKKNQRVRLGAYDSAGKGILGAMRLDEARKAAQELAVKILREADPAAERRVERSAPTFEQVSRAYLRVHAKHLRTFRVQERIVEKYLIPAIGNIKIHEVRRTDLSKVFNALLNEGNNGAGAPIMANRTKSIASRIFSWAIESGEPEYELLKKNPLAGMKQLAKESSRDTVLTVEQIKAVWNAFDELEFAMGTMFKLRLLTAQRGGEIEAMRWADIDRSDSRCWWWTIPKAVAKNKQSHRVPLSTPAIHLLADHWLESDDSEWVFPSSKARGKHIDWVQKAAARVRKLSGVEFVPHDLRRTAASHMASMKIPRLVVSKILNHADSSVTAVYERHWYDDEKREAMEMWAKRIYEITGKAYAFQGLGTAYRKVRGTRAASSGRQGE